MRHTIHVAQTSAGYRISTGEPITSDGQVTHITVSKVDGSLTHQTVKTITQLIVSLHPQSKLLAPANFGARLEREFFARDLPNLGPNAETASNSTEAVWNLKFLVAGAGFEPATFGL